jgi:hypothetical protein
MIIHSPALQLSELCEAISRISLNFSLLLLSDKATALLSYRWKLQQVRWIDDVVSWGMKVFSMQLWVTDWKEIMLGLMSALCPYTSLTFLSSLHVTITLPVFDIAKEHASSSIADLRLHYTQPPLIWFLHVLKSLLLPVFIP